VDRKSHFYEIIFQQMIIVVVFSSLCLCASS